MSDKNPTPLEALDARLAQVNAQAADTKRRIERSTEALHAEILKGFSAGTDTLKAQAGHRAEINRLTVELNSLQHVIAETEALRVDASRETRRGVLAAALAEHRELASEALGLLREIAAAYAGIGPRAARLLELGEADWQARNRAEHAAAPGDLGDAGLWPALRHLVSAAGAETAHYAHARDIAQAVDEVASDLAGRPSQRSQDHAAFWEDWERRNAESAAELTAMLADTRRTQRLASAMTSNITKVGANESAFLRKAAQATRDAGEGKAPEVAGMGDELVRVARKAAPR